MKVLHSFVITKGLSDYGALVHETKVPVFRVPALPFVYILGRAEALDAGGKM